MIIDLLANIAYIAVLQTFGVITTQPVPQSELHQVVPYEGKPITTIFSAERHCRFTGVAVPYERDWEIISENTMTHSKTVLPPEPGMIHSYAVILNKKTCPGKEPERVLLGGTEMTGSLFGVNRGIVERAKVMFTQISKNPDEQPKWLPQVMKVIEAAESTQPFVKEFLDYSRAGVTEAKPTQAQAAPAELTAAELNETAATQ